MTPAGWLLARGSAVAAPPGAQHAKVKIQFQNHQYLAKVVLQPRFLLNRESGHTSILLQGCRAMSGLYCSCRLIGHSTNLVCQLHSHHRPAAAPSGGPAPLQPPGAPLLHTPPAPQPALPFSAAALPPCRTLRNSKGIDTSHKDCSIRFGRALLHAVQVPCRPIDCPPHTPCQTPKSFLCASRRTLHRRCRRKGVPPAEIPRHCIVRRSLRRQHLCCHEARQSKAAAAAGGFVRQQPGGRRPLQPPLLLQPAARR